VGISRAIIRTDAYKGIYADVGIRTNQTWIGSTKKAPGTIHYRFQEYFGLSSRAAQYVIAFWNWGSIPVERRGALQQVTGYRRGPFRSGRGYTSLCFKSTQFNDTEGSRGTIFPITANGNFSGVAFTGMQNSNDEQGTKLFQVFQPGGLVLRVLFNKAAFQFYV